MGYNSQVLFRPSSPYGSTYYIVVSGGGSERGTYKLSVTDLGNPVTD